MGGVEYTSDIIAYNGYSGMKKIIIGCEEWCALPELNIPYIKTRIDSGAKTSSLHATNISEYQTDEGIFVAFDVFPLEQSLQLTVKCKARVIDKRVVKSSNNLSELRYVILTTLKLGGEEWEIEMTLSNRASMGYRMLLGREAMKKKLLVDPSESFLQGECDVDTILKTYPKKVDEKKHLKIVLLASNPDLYSNRRIMETAKARGHEVIFAPIRSCYMSINGKESFIHIEGGEVLRDIDVVVPRIRPADTFYACTLLRQFQSLGLTVFNDHNSIAQSRDKLRALQIMASKGLPLPVTGFAQSPDDIKDLIRILGGPPLIIKLLEGTKGSGVVLADTQKAAESVIGAFKTLKAHILIQEFIKEADGKDLRLFVVNGKVVAAMQRSAAEGEFRANIHLGGSAQAIKPTVEEKKLAIQAASAFNLKIAGVDIIRSSRGPMILEVNSSPGLEGIEKATGKDIAGSILAAIEKTLLMKRKVK